MKPKQTEKTPRVHLHPLMWCMVGLTAFAIGLFLAGFFVPPVGVIDGSVLKAGGEVIGLQVSLLAAYAIATGKTATITHGQTTATIGKDGEESANN